jgi:hypothetical protein
MQNYFKICVFTLLKANLVDEKVRACALKVQKICLLRGRHAGWWLEAEDVFYTSTP